MQALRQIHYKGLVHIPSRYLPNSRCSLPVLHHGRLLSSPAKTPTPPIRPPVDVRRPPKPEDRIPVLILTGFLGAGKTTLLNRILGADHGKRLAVIQNEFGEVGIDQLLTAEHFKTDDEIYTLNNGCLCCTVRSDLAPIVDKLYLGQGKTGKLDGIVVETTGLAVPGPVLQTFLRDTPAMLTRLDAVVTLVDAANVGRHFERAREAVPEAARSGLGSAGLLKWVKESLGRAAPVEPNECIEQVAFADVILLNKCDLVDEARLAEIEEELRVLNPFAKLLRCTNSDVPLDNLLGVHSFDLERIEGMLPAETGDDGTHGHSHSHGHGHGHGHRSAGQHKGDVVEGRHDSTVTSVSIRHTGTMDYQKMQKWMGEVIGKHGEQIYRMKGVVAMAGERGGPDEKLVYHGVHMFFQGDMLGKFEDGEARESRLVFIGKGLDGQVLRSGFLACSAD